MFFPGLVSNCHPPDFHILRRWDYRATMPGKAIMLGEVITLYRWEGAQFANTSRSVRGLLLFTIFHESPWTREIIE